MTSAEVKLWGRTIGAVEWSEERRLGIFQYTPEFAQSGIQVSPITLPLRTTPYAFPEAPESLRGLPGLLADSLPDKFGHRLIDAWLVSQGRTPGSMNPVERLCYINTRGMGALEFAPRIGLETHPKHDQALDIARLTRLANQVLSERSGIKTTLAGDGKAMRDILRIGTSAGGARAKALIAWHPQTDEIRSGQIEGRPGFQQWLLKFDGISHNRDHELADPQGYGKVEYAYALMARDAGIDMHRCRLHHEGRRSHFMTRRFDRTADGKKLHMLSLAALCHYDFNDPGSYSYEQAFMAIRQISAHAQADQQQQYLRALFNLVARNQDDHAKNIAFLMWPNGDWRLSPAFDVTYAWNPTGAYTHQHQMSINGKRDGFNHEDVMALAHAAGIKKGPAQQMIECVVSTVERWPEYAAEAGVGKKRTQQIARAHRLELAA